MCTVTFIPRRKGYCLGMNRDEKRTRPQARPPAHRNLNGHRVLYPSEPMGGTWIAVNDTGASFALINWYSVPQRPENNTTSRGIIIPSIASAHTTALTQDSLGKLSLRRMNPFGLVAVFPDSREITEWRWDMKRLSCRPHPWRAQQWISSGFDERRVQTKRSRTFRQKLHQSSVGRLDWLRRLHRSHLPNPGPFSTCMHRADASTVSYTEIVVTERSSNIHYLDGPPCRHCNRGSSHIQRPGPTPQG